jgi:hypothetical protein
MKNQIVLFVSKINMTHIQMALLVVALVLLVVGAGAVEDFGGIGRK